MDKFQVFLWCIVCVFVMEGTACYHSNTKRAAIARQDKIGVLLIIITQNRSVNNEIRANPTRCVHITKENIYKIENNKKIGS